MDDDALVIRFSYFVTKGETLDTAMVARDVATMAARVCDYYAQVAPGGALDVTGAVGEWLFNTYSLAVSFKPHPEEQAAEPRVPWAKARDAILRVIEEQELNG